MARDARTWADALLRHKADGGGEEKRAVALETVADAVAGPSPRSVNSVGRFLGDPRVEGSDKREALSALVPGDETWSAFCELLVLRKAYRLLPEIAKAYRDALDKRAGIARVAIETPRPLDADSRQAVLEAWRSILKSSKVVATETIRPELLGGFRFRSGSIRYDASVAGRLARLRAFLAQPLDRPITTNEGQQ